jgi:hypothetical protein
MTLYRAVALQAMVEAIDLQPVLGTAISLLIRNFGPLLEIGKNKAAFDLLVSAADAAFGAEVNESMAPSIDHKFARPKVSKPAKFDRAALQKRIDAAVGPHNRASVAGENPNPQWPNAGHPWSYDFSDRLTALLGDYLDNVVNRAFELDAKTLDAVAGNFNEAATRNASLTDRTTSLLWWRQALYSKSARQPYRELQPVDTVVHAVIDLSALIPAAYDRALESFLMEAVLNVLPSQDEIAGTELLKILPTASSELNHAIESEVPYGLMLSALVQNDGAATIVHTSLPLYKWAVWLLRELKALQALRSPKPVPAKKEGNDD